MYSLVKWSPELDLTEFYAEAERRGFVNNASQRMLVDSLTKEREWCVWILYYNNKAVGSVGAHSIEEGYRICARTCVFTDMLDPPYGSALRTSSVITKHQNPTAQFFIPVCLEWAGSKDIYITSHPSDVGTQKLVHTIWGPLLEKTGAVTRAFEKQYRGHLQTFWKLNVSTFQQQLAENPRWPCNVVKLPHLDY